MQEQVLYEVMPYIYPRDISKYYFLNKENYKEFEKVRELEGDKPRQSLILKKNGEYRRWYPNSKQLMLRCSYDEDGKKHGLYRIWNRNGQLQIEYTYENGEIHGLYHIWYSNGQLREECTFEDGKAHGLYRTWYKNGQLREECTCENGEIHGLFRKWHENGQLKEERTYEHGKLINV